MMSTKGGNVGNVKFRISDCFDVKQFRSVRQKFGKIFDAVIRDVTNFNAEIFKFAPQLPPADWKFDCRQSPACVMPKFFPNPQRNLDYKSLSDKFGASLLRSLCRVKVLWQK